MNAYRTVLQADLAPLAGSLFQPTGFPDLGAAEFERTPDAGAPESGHALIVESAQSMANWLEGTTWDEARTDQSPNSAPCPTSASSAPAAISCPPAGWKPTAWPPRTS